MTAQKYVYKNLQICSFWQKRCSFYLKGDFECCGIKIIRNTDPPKRFWANRSTCVFKKIVFAHRARIIQNRQAKRLKEIEGGGKNRPIQISAL